MATTFDYYVRPYQRADGSQQVQIKITHNRKSKYITTSIYVFRNDLTRDGKRIRNTLMVANVNERLQAYRDAFLKIKFPEFLSINQVVDAINAELSPEDSKTFRLDVFEFAETLYPGMEIKTVEGYRTALNAVKRFIGCDRLDINDITKAWALRFRSFLENEPPVTAGKGTKYKQKSRGSRAVSYYMGCLRHIHNMARLYFNDDDTGTIVIPRQPFSGNIIPSMPLTEHRDLSISQIRSIAESQPKPGSRAELARDVFMLSFALAGTNTIDLYKLKSSDVDGNLVTYKRSKTMNKRRDHAIITLKVLPEAVEIIEKYRGNNGYLLNFVDRYSNGHEFNRACNKGLKYIAELANIEGIDLQTGHARHSWATIARNVCRIDFDTVNAGLNHAHQGSDRIADIYIARDYTAIWRAQEKVMEEINLANSFQSCKKLQKTG